MKITHMVFDVSRSKLPGSSLTDLLLSKVIGGKDRQGQTGGADDVQVQVDKLS